MRKIQLLAWLLTAAILPAAATSAETDAQGINALADRYYEFRLGTQPEIAYFCVWGRTKRSHCKAKILRLF